MLIATLDLELPLSDICCIYGIYCIYSIVTKHCVSTSGLDSQPPPTTTTKELELLLCGIPEIDILEWKRHSRYLGDFRRLGEEHPVIKVNTAKRLPFFLSSFQGSTHKLRLVCCLIASLEGELSFFFNLRTQLTVTPRVEIFRCRLKERDVEDFFHY